MARQQATRAALRDEALAFGGPIIVFDQVNLAFDEKVILRDLSFKGGGLMPGIDLDNRAQMRAILYPDH